MTRADGRVMRTMPFVILINLAWLFFYPLIANLSFTKVILPTLVALPVFVYLHLCTYFCDGPAANRLRYITGVFVLGFTVVFFNLAAVGFLIFGFFSVSFSAPTRVAARVIGGAILVYLLEMIALGCDRVTILSCLLPAVLLGISAVYTAYTTPQQMKIRRSSD